MSFWPDKTPKSTGNAFSVLSTYSSGFSTGHEKTKVKRLQEAAEGFEAAPAIAGMSKKARRLLAVPAGRTNIALEGSAPGRIKAIPNAQRSSK